MRLPLLFAVILCSAYQASYGLTSGDYTYTSNASGVTITSYNGSGGFVAIPQLINGQQVKIIGDSSFSNCTTLTGVTIPSGVVSIGSAAFYNCRITNVDIPEGVTNIGSYAFSNCKS